MCKMDWSQLWTQENSLLLILIWQMVLIGFYSVWRISSPWEKIFSAVWEENNGWKLHFVGKLRLCIPDQALYKL